MSIITQLPIIKQIWRIFRERKILKKHQEVAQFWQPIIAAYYNNKITKYDLPAKISFENEKIIWQYWGQGTKQQDLPEVVQLCFDSVDQYKGDYQVIRLDDQTVKDYLDLPDFIIEKQKRGALGRTFYSDLLRIALLRTYGGVWLDATILLTGPIPTQLSEQPYFVYQRDPNVTNKSFWEQSYAYYWGWNPLYKVRMLNSIFFSKKKGNMVSTLLDLILYYHQTQEEIIDYFFFQILYEELINHQLKDEKCMLISDTIPHILQTKFNGSAKDISYQEALKNTNIHKMSYFQGDALKLMKDFVQNKIKNN